MTHIKPGHSKIHTSLERTNQKRLEIGDIEIKKVNHFVTVLKAVSYRVCYLLYTADKCASSIMKLGCEVMEQEWCPIVTNTMNLSFEHS